jgi:hypothetical protein
MQTDSSKLDSQGNRIKGQPESRTVESRRVYLFRDLATGSGPVPGTMEEFSPSSATKPESFGIVLLSTDGFKWLIAKTQVYQRHGDGVLMKTTKSIYNAGTLTTDEQTTDLDSATAEPWGPTKQATYSEHKSR